MILRKGNMFDFTKDRPGVVLFTGNSTVRKDGALVMGRGAAAQALRLFPGINKELGREITIFSKTFHRLDYGLILGSGLRDPIVGVFQVKHFWGDEAELDLITKSTTLLLQAAELKTSIPSLTYWMNFPGIGYGRLGRSEILPIISTLPDNVHVWEY